jgi:hypothetical protein
MIHHLKVIAAGALMALPQAGHAFTADNRLKVAQVDAHTFEVIAQPGTGTVQFWCAAGDYAFGALNADTSQRVYLVRGRGPSATQPGKKSVQFTLNPNAKGVPTLPPQLVLNVNQPGDNLSVAHAWSYCQVPHGRR